MNQTSRIVFAIIVLIGLIGFAGQQLYSKGYEKGAQAESEQPTAFSKAASEPEDLTAFTVENFSKKINQARTSLGLSALSTDSYLEEQAKSDVTQVCGNIKRPDFKLNADADRFKNYAAYGEIVSEDTKLPKDVLIEWINNANHQPILLRPEFTKIGIGTTDNYCVAVIFGN